MAAVAVVMAQRDRLLPFASWGWPVVGVVAAAAGGMSALFQSRWLPTMAHRVLCGLAPFLWIWWEATHDFSRAGWTALLVGAALLVAWAYLPEPQPNSAPVEGSPEVKLGPREQEWQDHLRKVYGGAAITVDRIEPWPDPVDGEKVWINLPVGTTIGDLENKIHVLQGARHLKAGCTIEVLDGDHQGAAVLDVMLRDTMTLGVTVDDHDHSEASINDAFPVMFTPRREPLPICLRTDSAVLGGAPDQGKTTLLHRIVRHLTHCPDTIINAIDLNGGGVARPWVEPWALGEAQRPPIDWVARDEWEAAAQTAVTIAILKHRKSSREAAERKRAARTWLLPVDERMPASVTLVDEGGEVAVTSGRLAAATAENLATIARIGRAEAGRLVMCVLRGTSDLLDKILRVTAAIRICLTMFEDDEYDHVLGVSPPRGAAPTRKGEGFLKRTTDRSPIFSRTIDIDQATIEETAVATQWIRPAYSEEEQAVARRVGPREVLAGREPLPEEMEHPVMRDAAQGLLYERRWERQARWLAEIRGEETPDDQPAPAPASPTPARSVPMNPGTVGGPLGDLLVSLGRDTRQSVGTLRLDVDDPAAVDAAAAELAVSLDSGELAPDPFDLSGRPAEQWPTRVHVLAILAHRPRGLTRAQLSIELGKRGAGVHRGSLHRVLAGMVTGGELVHGSDATYRLPL